MVSKTIIECFKQRVEISPNKIAIEYGDASFTWKQLDDISDVLAFKFISLGIARNTHTAICCLNNPNWVCSFLALQKIGSVAILLNPHYTRKEITQLIINTDIEYLCYDDSNKVTEYKEMISNISESKSIKFKKIIYIGESTDILINNSSALGNNDRKEIEKLSGYMQVNDTSCILFTSGTTSGPKGVMLSHYNIVNTSILATQAMHWTANDKMCVTVPFYHIFGLSACLMASIHCGCGIVLLSNLIKIDKNIERYKCTILNGVPSMFLAIIYNSNHNKYDLSTLNSGIIAGSYIPKKDYMKICSSLNMQKLQMSYGLTEASPSVTFSDYWDSIEKKSGNVGKAIAGIELSILNSNCIMTNCENTVGEILVKGFNVMKGYYGNPEETKKAIDEEGWLHTGDIGYFDEGHILHIAGRKKEVIIRSGEKVSPYEIEECILNYPGIMQTKVIGIKAGVTQEEIVTCIILRKDEQFDQEKFRKFLTENLAYYKIPKYIVEFIAFPMTLNGKIDLRKINEMACEKLNVANNFCDN
jgi:fatty-acyl-CoA synthase